MTKEERNFEDMLEAFLNCAIWSSHLDKESPDNDYSYSTEDISEEALEYLTSVARVFYQENKCYIDVLITESNNAHINGNNLYTLAGHDLWLTQAGHGTGFWDRDYWGKYRDMFTKRAENLGEIDLYIGDDGEIYA